MVLLLTSPPRTLHRRLQKGLRRPQCQERTVRLRRHPPISWSNSRLRRPGCQYIHQTRSLVHHQTETGVIVDRRVAGAKVVAPKTAGGPVAGVAGAGIAGFPVVVGAGAPRAGVAGLDTGAGIGADGTTLCLSYRGVPLATLDAGFLSSHGQIPAGADTRFHISYWCRLY